MLESEEACVTKYPGMWYGSDNVSMTGGLIDPARLAHALIIQ